MAGVAGRTPGRPTGPASVSTTPNICPACPAQHQASGQQRYLCPPRREVSQASIPGCWPFPNRTRGPSSEHSMAPRAQARPPPPPHQLQVDGVGCTVHGETEVLPACPSCPAPAQPSSSALVATGYWAEARAGVGQWRGRQALPYPGCRRGEVVGCVVSGQ